MRGTLYTRGTFVDGNTLSEDSVNDAMTILTSADDDTVFDLFAIDTPGGASLTNTYKGFIPLKPGPFLVGNPAGRTITIQPMRIVRSSISSFIPRNVVSTTIDVANPAPTLPPVPSAGLWGFELLCARLMYNDPSDPTMGVAIDFVWATSPTYVPYATAANFAILPSDSSNAWYVPLAYVRNYDTQTAIYGMDFIEVPPIAAGSDLDYLKRLTSARTGFDSARAYSSENNDPRTLVSGGTSVWEPSDQTLLVDNTPIAAYRRNVEHVRREIIIPPCLAGTGMGGTGGVLVDTTVIDDTRDWRGANCRGELWLGSEASAQFAEQNQGGPSAFGFPQTHYTTAGPGVDTRLYIACGQTWNTSSQLGSAKLWAAVWTSNINLGNPFNHSTMAVGDGVGLFADPTTGALMWAAEIAGAGSGAPAWIILDAWFGHHRNY